MAALTRIGLGVTRAAARLLVFAQRLLGLLGAADQLLLHANHPNPVALVVSGCLLAGAQAMETVVLRAIDRLMMERIPGAPAVSDVAAPEVDPRRQSADGGGR